MGDPIKLLSSTVLTSATLALAATPTGAQDIDALEKRVRALEKAAGGQTVARTKKTVSLALYGQINRLVQFVDNGTTSGFKHTTSIFSRSRVGWTGTGRIDDDLKVQTVIELGNLSSSSVGQALGANADADDDPLGEIHIDMRITSKTLGRLWVGQGPTGSETTSEQDLSGTHVLSLNGDEFLVAGAEVFQRDGVGIGRPIGFAFNNLDGHGRRDRIRYDTPRYSGFQITASHENADSWSAALRYGGSFGGVKIIGAVAYSDDSSRNGLETTNGSLSVLLPAGLSFTIAGGFQDDDRFRSIRDNAEMRYAKIGYRFNGIELGETRLFASWGEFDDMAAANEEARAIAFGVVQIAEPLGAELQLGYVNFSLKQPGLAAPDDIDVITAGVRMKF